MYISFRNLELRSHVQVCLFRSGFFVFFFGLFVFFPFVCLGYSLHWDTPKINMSFLFCLFICLCGLRFTLGHVTSVFSVLSFYLSVWVTVYIGTRQVCLFCSVFSFVCLGYGLH